MKNKSLVLIELVILVSIISISCNHGNQAHEQDNRKDTLLTIPATQTVISVADLDSGKYIFKTPKGNFISFKVSLMNDTALFVEQKESSSEKSKHSIALSLSINQNPPCEGPDFDASYRKKVKYTPSKSEIELLDGKKLFTTLASSCEETCNNKAKLPKEKRMKEEDRNVKLKNVYIYTFKRQGDEDYHVIIGTTSNYKTAKFFNAEISGLSPTGTYGRNKLVKARTDFESYFGISDKPCASNYYKNDWRDEPVPVDLTGSLFFDGEHCSAFWRNGPQNWKELEVMCAWEIHPITEIEFLK